MGRENHGYQEGTGREAERAAWDRARETQGRRPAVITSSSPKAPPINWRGFYLSEIFMRAAHHSTLLPRGPRFSAEMGSIDLGFSPVHSCALAPLRTAKIKLRAPCSGRSLLPIAERSPHASCVPAAS